MEQAAQKALEHEQEWLDEALRCKRMVTWMSSSEAVKIGAKALKRHYSDMPHHIYARAVIVALLEAKLADARYEEE